MKRTLVLFYLFFIFLAYGQKETYVNLRSKTFVVTQPEIQVDSISIQPYYFQVDLETGITIPPSQYQISFKTATLTFTDFLLFQNKKITIHYLAYPKHLTKTYQLYQPRISAADTTSLRFGTPEPEANKPFDGLKTQGSLTRGVDAGNNQNLVMQSGLDLKIEGKISPKVKVKAVLSDDNLPQAYAGISQSYKEFDRIYMQLTGENWDAIGGDLVLQNQRDYFLRFKRKTQGLAVQMGRDSSRVQVSGAYVEGQFTVNRFQGVEGNQGPYLLKGEQGETYIFVIPDTEKVYVNGSLLQAGIDKDYVLDYQTAELRFNPTFPITQNQRIVVEFNYSNQHYVRYLSYNRYTHKGRTTDFSISSYLEGDIKNKSLLFQPDAQQIDVLRNAGDQLQEMWVLSAKPVSYNENKILYKKVIAGTSFYFEHTTQDEPGLYEVRFSYVGDGQGDYIVSKVVANGKIYAYAGVGNGDYQPYIKLTAPEAKKYLGINFAYHPSEKTQFSMQSLLNHTDKNLFSTKNDADNIGGAMHIAWLQSLWQKDKKRLSADLKYDFVHQDFVRLDPYRPVEFKRQWQVDSVFGKQHLLDGSLQYLSEHHKATGGFRYYALRDTLPSQQMYVQAQGKWRKMFYQSDWQHTHRQTDSELQAEYIDQKLGFTHKNWLLTGDAHYEDRRQQKAQIRDTLNYKYSTAGLKISRKDSSRLGLNFYFKQERNDSIRSNRFVQTTAIYNVGGAIQKHGKNHQLSLFVNWRKSRYLLTNKQDKFLNIKANWNQYFAKRFLQTQMEIESFNGNTLRDEVVFVETPPGQGTHQWVDYNQNGIKEINEFEVALYSDQANYIRVVLPSKNYIPTLTNRYALRLIINPSVWQQESFWKHLYGILQFDTRHQVVRQNDNLLVWNPDEALERNQLWQQDWFVNRTKKRYHLHFTYRYLNQSQLLLVGQQARQLEHYQLQTKHLFQAQWLWKQEFYQLQQKKISQNYLQKNYTMLSKGLSESIAYKKSKQSEFTAYYHYDYKQNLTGNEVLRMQKIGLQYMHQNGRENLFHFDMKLVLNRMQGNTQSPVAFQMLESLQPGKNLVFGALLRRQINSYLVMDLHYNFRLSEQHSAIHNGGIRLKMLF